MSDILTDSAAAGAIVPHQERSAQAYETCGCGNPLFIHSTYCVACGAPVGFDPSTQRLGSFTVDAKTGYWQKHPASPSRSALRPCSKRQSACNCNWMIAADSVDQNCLSCRLTVVVPALDVPGHAELWGKAELAKRRVLTQLLRLSLPVRSMVETPSGLAFKFLATLPSETILTGHEDGVITINICEATRSHPRANGREISNPRRTPTS